MFGGSLWGPALGGNEDHLTKERDPPARPISPEFPSYTPPFRPHHLTSRLSSQLRNKICHVRSFADISDDDLAELNISYKQNVPLSDFVPPGQFQSRPLLYDDDLEAMLTEISLDNQDAFREVLRMPPLPGKTKPRLAYARNFFGSLEDLARYWDNSQDNYYQVPVNKSASSLATQSSVTNPQQAVPNSRVAKVSNRLETQPQDTEMSDSGKASPVSTSTTADLSAKSETKEVYKGYRIGNGEQLGPGTRVALVKNLIKMVTHKFHCRDHEPIPAPREKLTIRGVRIQSVQYHFCIARIPNDMKIARSRMVEGPLMAIQVRDEVRFKTREGQMKPNKMDIDITDTKESKTNSMVAEKLPPSATARPTSNSGPPFFGERFDMFREIGCMLILAAQRAREGMSKDSVTDSERWWVNKPRWGGGPTHWGQLASEIFEDEDPSRSPAEQQLQEAKKIRDAEARAKGKDGSEPIDSTKMSVDDLMASNAPDVAGVPGDPLQGPKKKKLRSLERPAEKDDDPSQFKDGRRLMYLPAFRKKWYQEWTKLRPNAAVWDDKIIYKHIGKDTESDFDDIYMVSAVNHHVCLNRMKVHPEYLNWLETGKEVPDEEEPNGSKKNLLYVIRSSWYDMFEIEARKEFLVALWSVMSWLNRDHVPQEELEKMQSGKQI